MRRLTSLLGILVIVALTLLLLWRVYRHHESAERREALQTAGAKVKIAGPQR